MTKNRYVGTEVKKVEKVGAFKLRQMSNRKLSGRRRSLTAKIEKTDSIAELTQLDDELAKVDAERARRDR